MIKSFKDREAEKIFAASFHAGYLKTYNGQHCDGLPTCMEQGNYPIREGTMREERMPPVHPGEILLEEFMKPLGLSQYRLAKAMHVYPRKVNEIVQGKRGSQPTLHSVWGVSLAHLRKYG